MEAIIGAPLAESRRLPVLDISEGGIRVAGLDLPVGTDFDFRLEGEGIECRGTGHVAHRTPAGAGVAVDRWIGTGHRIQGYVMARLLPQVARGEVYICDWA